MTVSVNLDRISTEALVEQFFRKTEGRWKSVRRYYTLKTGEPQEVTSFISIVFLEVEDPRLVELAKRHELSEEMALCCGSYVTWESHYEGVSRKPAKGSTVFGVKGEVLYRDRGFATPKPVIAQYKFTNPNTMCLHTEYDNSQFDEEIKLVGDKYRTRQTIIYRDGEEMTIGQYLETRLD
ncbi:MAG: phycobiliprotein lyase [Cyanobacteria bacterium SID2]|nr:phycobiliprotein lyase [Cyanobacteria bacterium SID2]